MKIAFSTLGCPGWSWDDIIVTAKDLGFNGIELRGIGNEIHVPGAAPFASDHLDATKDRLAKLKLNIPILTSACYLFDRENIQAHIQEGKEYIDLAAKLGTTFVRVLADRDTEPGNNIDLMFVEENFKMLADYAKSRNVTLLVETNGVLSDSRKAAEFIKRVSCSNAGILWDVHHPFRYAGESVDETYAALKDYIKYVHIKDSVMENGKVRYKMMGYGDIPVERALQQLDKNGFEGFVSMEWVKRWCMDLEEPGVVFSHFINYVRRVVE